MSINYSTVVQIRNGSRWQFFSQQAWIEGKETPLSDGAYLAACQQLEEKAKLRIMPLSEGETFPVVHAGTLMDEAS